MSGRTAAVAAAVMAAIWAAAGGVSVAGTLEPPGPPSSTNSAMYTLQDVYNRLTTGATTNKRAGAFTEPTAGPTSGTMRTVDEIYSNAIPRVPKTGAGDLPSYTEVAGEDGHASMRKGVAWPNPRFTDNNDGTVTDNLTGLIWLKNANVSGTANWQTALDRVVELNASGKMNNVDAGDTSNGGGHQTDWRLPNVQELQSLIDYGRYNPALCNTAGTGQWTAGDPFTGVQSSHYWSSTTFAGNTTYAWDASLYNSVDYMVSAKSDAIFVWPVRGGQ